ncbi:MAG TPA: GNAT family N-acetyltransferase [Vicinamibacteria bacterium]|nr:GNAT family N-acetyltransferase [Vicinamibacteria bacterium]
MILRTPRLTLHPFSVRDGPALHRQWNDHEIRRFLFDDRPVPRSQVREQIAASRRLFRERGFGFFTVRRRTRTIGFGGLRPFGRRKRIELLYALRPAHWAKGYATEASVAVLRLAFARGLRTIWAGADAPNRTSFRLMRRLGFQPAGRFTVGGRSAIDYRIDRRRFANASGLGISPAGPQAAVAPRLPRLRGARQSEGRG